MRLIAEGMRRSCVFEAHRRRNFSGKYFLHLLALVSLQANNAGKAFSISRRGIVDIRSRFNTSRIHSEKRELANERVALKFKDECGKRLFVARVAKRGLTCFYVRGLNGGHIKRRGQVINDGVEHKLYSFVFESRSGKDGKNLICDDRFSEGGFQHFKRRVLAFELLAAQTVILLNDSLDKLSPILLCFLDIVGRNILFDHLNTLLALKIVGFHLQKVDDAFKMFFKSDRDLHANRVFVETVQDRSK